MLQDNSLSYSEKESPIVFGRALLLQFLFLEILYNDLINRWIYNSSCLYYCKDTLFEAIHNVFQLLTALEAVVCITAKIHFLKQFTTLPLIVLLSISCLYYCKDTLFEAIHNMFLPLLDNVVLFVLLQRYTF